MASFAVSMRSGAPVRASVARRHAAKRPTALPALRTTRARTLVVRSKPDVEKAIEEAKEVCEGGENEAECATAWDQVEELAAAVSRKKAAEANAGDPLDKFCEEVPEADECRVYED
ncbi:unnamed protein product [Ostreobium quekettii]|uniref:CP12 domain-containing protein n=1 Tax=Ostreobium quekettii TaxID=121088 RepID=A0A8S1IWN5_9CHLO|nr:unnamed protein product [Ostreobium quekettii]|eukprot:evm.model.scf_723.5 EVM.evm.TU.scf_723.5   scf_723:29021-31429(+)